MKKIIMVLLIVIIPFVVRAEETCEMNQIVIESVTVSNKVGKSGIFEEPNVEDNKVRLNLNLSDEGDSVEHKIVLRNNSDEDYKINKKSFNIDSNYIDYILDFAGQDDIIKANSEKTIYIKAEYKNEIPDELFTSGVYSENKSVNINMSNKSGIIDDIINPKTGVRSYVTLLLIILILSIIVYYLVKKKEYSHTLIIIICTLLIIPIYIYAVCNYEINLDINLEIEETVSSTVLPNFFEYDINNGEVTINDYKRNIADTYVDYKVRSESKCKSYINELWIKLDYDFEENDVETICRGETTGWGDTLSNYILNRIIPKLDYKKAGLRNVIQPINIYYNITNKTKCENYIKGMYLDLGADEEYANTYAPIICLDGHDDRGYSLEDYIYYEIPEDEYDDAGISIIEKNTPSDIVIPKTIENKPVTKLGFYSFNSKGLTSVVLPSTLKEIGGYQEDSGAFIYNNLTKIVIPEGVEIIGDDAFHGNKLESVTLPSTLKSIGERAFENNKLKTINIPYGVEVVGLGAFEQNYLTSVTLPETVRYLGYGAFNNNKLPDSQAFFYERSDENDDGIAEIDYTSIVSYGGANKNVVIPDGVVTLGAFAFAYRDWYSSFGRIELDTVTIPSSVMKIHSYAFMSDNLKHITIQGKSSASEFTEYAGTWYWDSSVTCVKNNTSNVENGCITWEGN